MINHSFQNLLQYIYWEKVRPRETIFFILGVNHLSSNSGMKLRHFNWGSLVLNVLIASIREQKVLKAANLKGNLALPQSPGMYII
jgi:hypothetical protein